MIAIDPQEALIDEPISIHISQLEPFQTVTLRASLHDEMGMQWSSSASCQADAQGTISLSDIDPLDLFSSMEPEDSLAPAFRHSGEELKVTFALGDQTASISRLIGSPHVKRLDIREKGLVGTLFLPPSSAPLPVILVLGGAGGGLKGNRAHLLASHGFATFSLAYFGEPGLPEKLERIPLEYFQTALDFLGAHPAIDAKRIGIWGISRGGELALLLGTLFPERIQALCACVPSSIAWGILPTGNTPAWLWKGKPLLEPASFPFLQLRNEEGRSPQHPLATSRFFTSEEFPPASTIPVEKILSPLLLLSGDEDEMWPSTLFCHQIEERLREKNSITPFQHICYPGAGHHFSLPTFPTTRSYELHGAVNLWCSFGGTPKANAVANRDSWQQVVQFLLKIFS